MDLEIKSKIISFLRNNESASASDISKAIDHNRITIGKYLQILEAQKLVVSKKVASAIHWQLAESSNQPRVLIVDDEPHIVELIRLSLGEGYDIHVAYDGEEALEIANSVIPSLIVLDIMMPKKNGFEVCNEIKNNPMTQKIPIMFLSAKGDVADKIKAMELGAEDYLVKPFDPLELEARVAGVMRRLDSLTTRNSITNLPNRIFTQEIMGMWASKGKWKEYSIKLDNFDDYVSQFGHKKGAEVIKLLARMLMELMPDKETYLGHKTDTSFAIFSDKKIGLKDLQKKFDNMSPFFYTEACNAKKIAVHCEEIGHD